MIRFRIALALTGFVLLLAFAGVGAAQQHKEASLLGLVPAGQERSALVRLDPLTLKRRPGRALEFDSGAYAWSFSPDRSMLVFGVGSRGRLLLVDVQGTRMRSLGRVSFFETARLYTTFWPDAGRLFAVVAQLTRTETGGYDRGQTMLATVDPATRAVVAQQPLEGSPYACAHGPGLLVLLMGPDAGIGPARLAVVDSEGGVRTVPLADVSVGYEGFSEGDPTAIEPYAQPGLVVAPDARTAFVAAPDRIAAIDLRTLDVSYHRIGPVARQLQRVEKGMLDGSTRFVWWVRDGVLLVSGHDDRGSVGSEGRPRFRSAPAGASLVDTKDWSTRMIDSTASYVSIGGGAILAMGFRWNDQRQQPVGSGLTLYGLDGAKRAHLFGKQWVWATVVGGRAFAERPSRYSILSTRTARILRTIDGPMPYAFVGRADDF